jgi:hypothetical protein
MLGSKLVAGLQYVGAGGDREADGPTIWCILIQTNYFGV